MTSLLSISLIAPSVSHLNNQKYTLLKNNIVFITLNIEGIFSDFKFNQRDYFIDFLCQKTPFVIHWLKYKTLIIQVIDYGRVYYIIQLK